MAKCKIATHPDFMAALIFKLGDTEGGYIQFERLPNGSPTTMNFGSISVKSGEPVPVDATGGLSTRPGQMDAMVVLLRTKPFLFVPADKLATIADFNAPPCGPGWD
ncbi:MAG: hypothetical protein ACRED8_08865 [Caulobacteraceae bacterium]